MKINSKNAFSNIFSKEERLNLLEKKLLNREKKILDKQSKDKKNLIPEKFFTLGYKQGYEQGIKEGTKRGVQSSVVGTPVKLEIEPRAEGGPVTKGKPYLVGDAPSPYFELSIGRKDPNDLKSNVVTESFFDTGKGRSSDFYEEKTSDGTTLFRDKTELIGSSMTQSSYRYTPTVTETDKDGGVETFTETETLSSRISSIAKDDLIKHQDQLLGEIHKIKGFEDVTIDDVLKGTTGLPKDTMFNILSNSDASFATNARTEEQNRMPTDYFVNASDNFRSESTMTYNSEGVQPSKEESNQFASLASNINQSVNKSRVKTVIQPVIQTQIQQVPTPVPMSSPSTQITQISKSKLPPSIAKMIN